MPSTPSPHTLLHMALKTLSHLQRTGLRQADKQAQEKYIPVLAMPTAPGWTMTPRTVPLC